MVCADLKVPADWSEPDGRKITLKLGRLAATGEREGTALVAYGGPGGPGIGITQAQPGQWSGLRARMDVVTWDTRGYGAQFGGLSEGLKCTWTRIPYPLLPRDDAEFSRLSDTNRGYVAGCRAQDPELFANMSAADHAKDMEAIRTALGEPELNFYGASYAGLFAQAYARLFPDRVRTLVLDGTINHSDPDWRRETAAHAKANSAFMKTFLDWCECARSWKKILRAEWPIPAGKGVAYDVADVQTLALGTARQGRAQWPALAKAVRAAADGDASAFVPARGGRYPDLSTPITECLDWPRFGSRRAAAAEAARLREAAPYTGTAGTLTSAILACEGWPVAASNPPAALPDGLPPLLGAGAWLESDTVARVLRRVPGSVTIRHDGPGHTLYAANACARGHIDRYLTDATLPPRDTTC
jgi:pimeloyl-ACP methyl ester carboxylesterase